MTPNKLSPIVQSLIALTLLAMFAVMMFLPALVPAFKVESDTKQTLFTLVTAVVFFFIGKNTDSAQRDSQITAAVIGSIPGAANPAVLPDTGGTGKTTPVPVPPAATPPGE
jgi:hypothetical protein